MLRINNKIPRAYRYFLYLTLSISCCTGTAFWLMRRYAMVEGDFGPEPHSLQYPLLQVHGLGAFLMLLCLGAIFSAHIPSTWSLKRAKKSGLLMLVTVTVSLLSAYSLYYLVQDQWQSWLGNSHFIFGLPLPFLLLLHIKVARRSKRLKACSSES
jgi:MFS family permease